MANVKPNILVIWGDDIGIWNLSCYSHGTMRSSGKTRGDRLDSDISQLLPEQRTEGVL